MKEPVYRGWLRHALRLCVCFVWVIGLNLNKAVSSNVPSRSNIDKRGIVRAAWPYSTAKRVKAWVANAGDSRR